VGRLLRPRIPRREGESRSEQRRGEMAYVLLAIGLTLLVVEILYLFWPARWITSPHMSFRQPPE
jgi:hypothetical protein